ncbi:hypothetical protein GCM10010149_47720 [Nonomuraea roseoviolacea subsp. roseoviolacea]
MSHPPQQPPNGQPYGYGPPQQPHYPPPAYGPPMPYQPRQAVTKPAWTIGQILAIVCTCGLAWPLVWLHRRSKTTITRYR